MGARAPESGGDDVPLAYAYDDLASMASDRCLGVGRHQYEVRPDQQRFETRGVGWSIQECRDEIADVPAYVTQIAWHLGRLDDGDVRSAVALCAELLVTLNRIEARAADCG